MNLSTITKPLALITVGTLALVGCTAGVEPEYVTAQDEWAESDYIANLALELAWADTDAADREVICWGFDNLGEDWVTENWDHTSGIPVSLAHEFLEEECS